MRWVAIERAIVGFVMAFAMPSIAAADVDGHWMWYGDSETEQDPPSGKVWFRREVRAVEPATGVVHIAADEPFVLWVNGQRVGAGEGSKPYRFNLSGLVDRGVNVVAMEVENKRAPAGVLVDGEILHQTGNAAPFDAPADWFCTLQPPGEAWLQPGYDTSAWMPARDLGPHADSPWRDIAFADGYRDRFDVAPGLDLVRIAEPELVGSLVAITWGNRDRLIASREEGSILALIDSDSDGTYDRAVEYCSEVKNSQGLCQVGDELYAVGNGPGGAGIYRLPDHDHDDRADGVEQVALANGEMGEHGPHDVLFGPDGWLYHNLGNHAFVAQAPQPDSPVSPPYEGDLLRPRFEDGHGHAAGMPAPGGTNWRFSPDGSKWWLETAGFRNHYDIAFNRQAELFTFDSDMEWDVGQSWYRPVRVNHCVPGGEFGWRSGTAIWPDYYYDSLPATIDIGRGSPTGVVFYEHTHLPTEYHDSFLICDWSLGRILAVRLTPAGASYTGTVQTLVTGNPLNVSDIEIDRDGSVIFATGGRDTEGGLYRVFQPGAARRPARANNVAQLARLPQPQAAWFREDAARIKAASGDSWRVELAEFVKSGSPAEAVQVLSILAQQGPRPSRELLTIAAGHADSNVRAMAALLLADHPRAETAKVLNRLLTDKDPRVARRACEGIVRSGIAADVNTLLRLLEQPDRWLRFAARLALEKTPSRQWQNKVLTSDHPLVVLEGCLALVHRTTDAARIEKVLARAVELIEQVDALPSDQRLDALRLAQLALLHGAKGPPADRLGELLLARFPTGDAAFDREAVRVLASRHVRGAAEKFVEAIERPSSQEDQLHMALALAYLRTGVDDKLVKRVLKWYESTTNWEGGYSLALNVENIVAASVAHMSPAARRQVILGWKAGPRAAGLVLRRSKPDKIAGYEECVTDLLADVARSPGVDGGEMLVAMAVDSLAKSDSAASSALLRKLFGEHPDRRDSIARALAARPRPENVPYLLGSLQFGDTATLQICLASLARCDQAPEGPEPLRNVILAGLKLGSQGGMAAVELLGRWTGKSHTSGLNAVAALAEFQDWFHETYPDQPRAELATDDASKSPFTLVQLLAMIDGPAALTGDVTRGEAVFTRANCIKCHRFLNKGEGVGPDLTTVRRRFQRKEIMDSLVNPSQVISDQYRSVIVTTKAGQVFSGLRTTKDGEGRVGLLLSDATRIEIAGDEIEEVLPSPVSVMPEGLMKDVSPQELADLFAYLETSRTNSALGN